MCRATVKRIVSPKALARRLGTRSSTRLTLVSGVPYATDMGTFCTVYRCNRKLKLAPIASSHFPCHSLYFRVNDRTRDKTGDATMASESGLNSEVVLPCIGPTIRSPYPARASGVMTVPSRRTIGHARGFNYVGEMRRNSSRGLVSRRGLTLR